jgi:DNA-binding MarR family transcriptional regulator
MLAVRAILARVQVTAEQTKVSPRSLSRDLFKVMMHLLTTSSPDFFAELGELDISLTQVKLLHRLQDAEDGATLKDLAESFRLSLPAASRAVDGLHQRGLVERRENELDRRSKHVTVTPAGRDVVRRINEIRLAALERFAASLTDQQRRRLSSALAPIVARDDICGRDR